MSVIAITSEGSEFDGYARGGCALTGARYQVPASADAVSRFAATSGQICQDEVPSWPVQDLREMYARCEPWEVEDCEHLLAVLSDHRSDEAFDLLAQLRMEVPSELKEFSEIAFARALGWLGFEYRRCLEDTAPSITPVAQEQMAACS